MSDEAKDLAGALMELAWRQQLEMPGGAHAVLAGPVSVDFDTQSIEIVVPAGVDVSINGGPPVRLAELPRFPWMGENTVEVSVTPTAAPTPSEPPQTPPDTPPPGEPSPR